MVIDSMADADVRLLQAELGNATEVGRAREIMDLLKKSPMTFALLVATKVAKTVKAAKKRFPELRSLAKEVIKSWQQLDPKRVKAAPVPSSTASLGSERDSVRAFLEKEVGGLAAALEQEIFDNFDKTNYRTKARSLKFNLNKNANLKARFLAGEITPKTLAMMTSAEMASEEQQKLQEQVTKESTDARRTDWLLVNNVIKEGMFKCGKCRSNKTTYYQQQTRGADEPMTTFVSCTECGNSWKF